MSDYLPDVYLSVRRRFPEVAQALDDLARVTEGAGPLPAREQRLVKLGISIGALAEGAVRSKVRKALDVGVTADEIRHTALLAITTRGRPEVDRRSARRVVRIVNSVWSWRRRGSARGSTNTVATPRMTRMNGDWAEGRSIERSTGLRCHPTRSRPAVSRTSEGRHGAPRTTDR